MSPRHQKRNLTSAEHARDLKSGPVSDSTPTEAIRGPVGITRFATPSSQPKKPDALASLIGGVVVVVLMLSCCCGSPLLLFSSNTESKPRVKTLYEKDLERGELLAFEIAVELGRDPPTLEEARKFARQLADDNRRRRSEHNRLWLKYKPEEKLGTEPPTTEEGR